MMTAFLCFMFIAVAGLTYLVLHMYGNMKNVIAFKKTNEDLLRTIQSLSDRNKSLHEEMKEIISSNYNLLQKYKETVKELEHLKIAVETKVDNAEDLPAILDNWYNERQNGIYVPWPTPGLSAMPFSGFTGSAPPGAFPYNNGTGHP